MKALNVLIALLFTMNLAIAAAPVEGYAASDKKEVSSSKSVKSTSKDAKKTTTTSNKLKPKSISINTADKKTLTQLPGIGPKTG